MEAALVRLPSGKPRLPTNTPRTERVSIPLALIAPLSLAHTLMVAQFMYPFNAWHTMHVKAEAMGITQQVIMFMQWLRSTTVALQ